MMNSFNEAIDPVLLCKVSCGDIPATVELGEIFYQQQRYGFATSLFRLASKQGDQKATERLADIDRLIYSHKTEQEG
ncbi:MAG: hypothetical protein A2103_00995 [Gammaproteobacteria bacterium GWF2_41_13]|nr:MAG: hypothetical protein A2103_00995 [Gammaproteobacteria bacterium GWF2_41_13]